MDTVQAAAACGGNILVEAGTRRINCQFGIDFAKTQTRLYKSIEKFGELNKKNGLIFFQFIISFDYFH